jgi:hypothetical protein
MDTSKLVRSVKMTNATIEAAARTATQKISTGALLRLNEVAALLDVAPATVHRLALPSIRLGHSLRFSPADVTLLIEASKEPLAA